jgi:hypothetical protein
MYCPLMLLPRFTLPLEVEKNSPPVGVALKTPPASPVMTGFGEPVADSQNGLPVYTIDAVAIFVIVTEVVADIAAQPPDAGRE